MDFFTELEISLGPNWFFHPQQNDSHKMIKISTFGSFYEEFSTRLQLPYKSKKLNELDDIENINFDFNLQLLEEYFEVDKKSVDFLLPKPSLKSESHGFGDSVKEEFEEENEEEVESEMALTPFPNGGNKSSSSVLEFDEIKKHFHVRESVAAEKMNVTLAHLKRRCRELKIKRWPYRKMNSLETLIDNLKKLGLENEVVKVEKHKKMLEKYPNMQLNQEIKKLRQACYKANYKRRPIIIID